MGFIQEIINKILNRLKPKLESLEAKFYFFWYSYNIRFRINV